MVIIHYLPCSLAKIRSVSDPSLSFPFKTPNLSISSSRFEVAEAMFGHFVRAISSG